MSPLEEPTLGEIIRDLQGDLQRLNENLAGLVTKAEYDAHVKDVDKRLTGLEEGRKRMANLALSGFVGPFLVVLVAYVLGMKP